MIRGLVGMTGNRRPPAAADPVRALGVVLVAPQLQPSPSAGRVVVLVLLVVRLVPTRGATQASRADLASTCRPATAQAGHRGERAGRRGET
jgi:hypothetical protein